jgi:hypothetical protein
VGYQASRLVFDGVDGILPTTGCHHYGEHPQIKRVAVQQLLLQSENIGASLHFTCKSAQKVSRRAASNRLPLLITSVGQWLLSVAHDCESRISKLFLSL